VAADFSVAFFVSGSVEKSIGPFLLAKGGGAYECEG